MIFFHGDEDATEKATGIALSESALKMLFYYFHERVWYKINFRIKIISRKRHIAKTLTWRVIASLTTLLITLFVFKDSEHVAEKASAVMVAEIFTKMLIYYLHERAWYKIDFGINRS